MDYLGLLALEGGVVALGLGAVAIDITILILGRTNTVFIFGNMFTEVDDVDERVCRVITVQLIPVCLVSTLAVRER